MCFLRRSILAASVAAIAFFTAAPVPSAIAAEATLQQLLDTQFGPGALSATADRMAAGSSALWSAADTGATATLQFEIAGYAPYNVFGIYDSTSPSLRLPLFYGNAAPGAESSLSVQTLATGGHQFTASSNGVTESGFFGSSVFGFYLSTPGDQVFYSDAALNGDGFNHLAAYRTSIPALDEDFVWPDSHLLAWEDLLNGGDMDFNDLGLTVRGFLPATNVAPVPLPAGLWLLGSGLLGLAGFRRRQLAYPRP